MIILIKCYKNFPDGIHRCTIRGEICCNKTFITGQHEKTLYYYHLNCSIIV